MTEQTALMNDAGASDQAGTSAPPPTPPTGHPTAPAPRLPWYRVPIFRDPDDNMLGGVVSGVSQAYGFDRRTSRLALVIAGLVLPILVLVYIVAWILLPEGQGDAQPLEHIVRDKRRFPLYAALALVVLVGGIGSLGSWLVFGDFPWGVGLIAIGVLLWMAPGLRRDRQGKPTGQAVVAPTQAGTPTSGGWPTPADAPADTRTETAIDAHVDAHIDPGTDAAAEGLDADVTTTMPITTSTWTSPADAVPPGSFGSIGSVGSIGSISSDGSTLAPPAPTSRRRRRRIPIGSMSLLAAFAFVGVASAGDAIGWWNANVLGIMLVSIATVAIGLAVSTIVNRAWFFVPVVAMLALAAGFLSVADPSLDGGIANRTVRPTTTAEAERVHELGVGQLTLDLGDVPLDADRPLRIPAELGIGRLHVIVPAGAELVITSDVGAGSATVGDRAVIEGVDQRDARTVEAITDRLGTIELDLRVGIGEIDIERELFPVSGTTD